MINNCFIYAEFTSYLSVTIIFIEMFHKYKIFHGNIVFVIIVNENKSAQVYRKTHETTFLMEYNLQTKELIRIICLKNYIKYFRIGKFLGYIYNKIDHLIYLKYLKF